MHNPGAYGAERPSASVNELLWELERGAELGRAIRPVPFSGTDLQSCCEFSILLANPVTCGINSVGCLLMRMLMVCGEGLCISFPDQCSSAGLGA